MKVQDRLKAINRHIKSSYRRGPDYYGKYPREILDLVVFHKIHFHMDEVEALQSYGRLKSSFVDWNEVRISSIREIQEILGPSPDSLEVAIFIKDLLEFLHQKRHCVNMEFLAEENISEIRRFLRQVKGIEATTINLVLRLRKDYPILPVNAAMEHALSRLGVVRPSDSRDQKAKYLHNLLEEATALPFHHFLLKHSRVTCPPDESQLRCEVCGIRASCNYYSKQSRAAERRRGRKKA